MRDIGKTREIEMRDIEIRDIGKTREIEMRDIEMRDIGKTREIEMREYENVRMSLLSFHVTCSENV